MNTNKHKPVLLNETIESFRFRKSKSLNVYDATFGGGGHTAAILAHFQDATVMAGDMDLAAIENGKTRFSVESGNGKIFFFHGNFKDFPSPTWNDQNGWDIILADLGYSSNQLEDPVYGMSFQTEGPLDMRLTRPPQGPSAWDLISKAPVDKVGDIIRAYGEFPGAHRLAHQMRKAVESGEITDSTLSLSLWMEKKFPRRGSSSIHPATLLFQALRIAVNDELRSLDQFLKNAILKLNSGGLLLVITFHSLEDRIVKQVCNGADRELECISKKPITSSAEESLENPRARSAKLRVYRKR